MSNIKIIGINSSPRGKDSQTLQLVKNVLKGAESAGATIELVDVCELDIKYCIACSVCYQKGECIHKDDFKALFTKMLESDGIVLGSPVYIYQVTAQLKALMDRMSDAIHCQKLTGKYGCSVSTAGGSGLDEVNGFMNNFLGICGALTTGSVGAIAGHDPKAMESASKDAFDMGIDLVSAIKEGRSYPEQEAALAERSAFFGELVMRNKDIWVQEYNYLKDKGVLK